MLLDALKNVFSVGYLAFLLSVTGIVSVVAWNLPGVLQENGQTSHKASFNNSDATNSELAVKSLSAAEIDSAIDRALQLRLDGKYTDAFQILYPLSHQGVLRAKLYLGVAYYHGHGVSRDVERSRSLFMELLDKNYEPGIVNTYLNLIGSMHVAG